MEHLKEKYGPYRIDDKKTLDAFKEYLKNNGHFKGVPSSKLLPAFRFYYGSNEDGRAIYYTAPMYFQIDVYEDDIEGRIYYDINHQCQEEDGEWPDEIYEDAYYKAVPLKETLKLEPTVSEKLKTKLDEKPDIDKEI